MPRATAAAAAETASRVLDAASELFADRGFSQVSLDDVARTAAVTRGAIYHHYRNKIGLFLAVATRLQERVAGAVVDAAERAGDDAQSQLRAGSHAFVDAITSDAVIRILVIDAPSVLGWEEWRRLDAENSEQHLREALRSTGVAADLLDATAVQLSGAMNEAAASISRHSDPEAAKAAAHRVLDQLISAVL